MACTDWLAYCQGCWTKYGVFWFPSDAGISVSRQIHSMFELDAERSVGNFK
jgi:hypothetical protein